MIFTNNSYNNYSTMLRLTIIGLVIGHLLRREHEFSPFDKYVIITWGVLSIFGLVLSDLTELFYFMTMVSVGWGMREVSICY